MWVTLLSGSGTNVMYGTGLIFRLCGFKRYCTFFKAGSCREMALDLWREELEGAQMSAFVFSVAQGGYIYGNSDNADRIGSISTKLRSWAEFQCILLKY